MYIQNILEDPKWTGLVLESRSLYRVKSIHEFRYVSTPDAILCFSTRDQKPSDLKRARISGSACSGYEYYAADVVCVMACFEPIQLSVRSILAMAVDLVRLFARKFFASCVQYVCSLDVWRSGRKLVGLQEIRIVLLYMCHWRGAGTIRRNIRGASVDPDRRSLGRCFWNTVVVRDDVSESTDLSVFHVSRESKMVCYRIWRHGVDRRVKWPINGGQLRTFGWNGYRLFPHPILEREITLETGRNNVLVISRAVTDTNLF